MISRSKFLVVWAAELILALAATAALPTMATAQQFSQKWGLGTARPDPDKLKNERIYDSPSVVRGAHADVPYGMGNPHDQTPSGTHTTASPAPAAQQSWGGQNWDGYGKPDYTNKARPNTMNMYQVGHGDDSRYIHNNFRTPHADDPYTHGAITKNYDVKNPQDRALISTSPAPAVQQGGQNWDGYGKPDYTNKARPNTMNYQVGHGGDSGYIHNNFRTPHADDPYWHGAIIKNYAIKNPQDRALSGTLNPPTKRAAPSYSNAAMDRLSGR